MRISDWSSDVCSSDLVDQTGRPQRFQRHGGQHGEPRRRVVGLEPLAPQDAEARFGRSEEHTSELQSLMRISYAVFCLKKKNKTTAKRQLRNAVSYKIE